MIANLLQLALGLDAVSLASDALERAIADAVNFVVALDSESLDLAAAEAAVRDGNFAAVAVVAAAVAAFGRED